MPANIATLMHSINIKPTPDIIFLLIEKPLTTFGPPCVSDNLEKYNNEGQKFL